MHIIVKNAFRFYHPGKGVGDPGNLNDLDKAFKNSVHVKNIPEPQEIPDWVKQTHIFKWGIADGSIVEVVIPKVVPKAKDEAPAKVKK